MASLVGFRFKPNDEEIIFLLKQKRLDPNFSVDTVTELDIYGHEPWELPGFSVIQSKEEVWYYFCEPYYKYAKSNREHRRTKTGYWKSTGKGSQMKAKKSREVIGTKRILPFRSSENPKTEWVMHEIAVKDDPLYKNDFVICRIERKRNTKRGISTSDEDQSSPDLGSCSSIDVTGNVFMGSVTPPDQTVVSNRNHVAENIFSKMDNSISDSRNHVAENTGLDSVVPASGHVISHSRNHDAENTCAEPRLPAESNPGDGYNGLSDAFFSALLSPFHPELESSHSNGSSYGCDILNTQFYSEINSQWAFQNESSPEERGQTITTPDFNPSKSDGSSLEAIGETFSPEFNSSNSDGRIYVENNSDMDSETFLAWAEAVFENKKIHYP